MISVMGNKMSDNRWDAYLLPICDRFLTVSDISKRQFEKCSGFTGSAGTIIIMHEESFLFVDGRYVLQAQKETDECAVISDVRPLEWLKNYAAKEVNQSNAVKKVLAINPWAISVKEAYAYQDAVRNTNWVIEWDLKDCMYNDALPKSAIEFIEDERTFQEKCTVVFGAGLSENILICKAEDTAWLTNLRGNDLPCTPIFQSYLVVSCKDGIFSGQIFTALPRFLSCKDPRLSFCDLKELEPHILGQSFYFDPESAPYGFLLFEADWKERSSKIASYRSKKTPCEIHHMVEAHVKDGVGLTRFLHWLSTIPLDGQETEWSAAEKLAYFRCQNQSYKGPSFPTISAFADNSAIVHYRPLKEGSSRLKEGIFLIDSGGQYHLGTTDITRTIWLGKTPPLLYQQRFTAVLQGHIHLASLIFPKGANGFQLDAIARSFLWQQGVDYAHGTGHGIGAFLSVHESPPSLSYYGRGDSLIPIEDGMIFSNEPGYYEANWGGIRLENIVKAENHSSALLFLQTISLAPFDHKLILSHQLSWAHRKWLNDYHQEVCAKLAHLLDEQTRSWLLLETAPL